MDDQKYVCFVWHSDDEGGYGVCRASEFTRDYLYDPESGPHAQPSRCLAYFDTVSELAEILYKDGSQIYDYLIENNIKTPWEDAVELMKNAELL